MLERRIVTRNKSFLQGRVFFNNRLSSVDCVIRDITDRGARLKFGGAVNVPQVFELTIPNKNENFRAHVIWNHGAEIGVAFDPAKPAIAVEAKSGNDTVTDRIDRLERDVAALKRRLDELRPSD